MSAPWHRNFNVADIFESVSSDAQAKHTVNAASSIRRRLHRYHLTMAIICHEPQLDVALSLAMMAMRDMSR